MAPKRYSTIQENIVDLKSLGPFKGEGSMKWIFQKNSEILFSMPLLLCEELAILFLQHQNRFDHFP